MYSQIFPANGSLCFYFLKHLEMPGSVGLLPPHHQHGDARKHFRGSRLPTSLIPSGDFQGHAGAFWNQHAGQNGPPSCFHLGYLPTRPHQGKQPCLFPATLGIEDRILGTFWDPVLGVVPLTPIPEMSFLL